MKLNLIIAGLAWVVFIGLIYFVTTEPYSMAPAKESIIDFCFGVSFVVTVLASFKVIND